MESLQLRIAKMRIAKKGLAVGLLFVLFSTAVSAGGTRMYVYEMPNGTRIVTDYALNNKQYRLVRTGHNARGLGHLVASKNSQFFRADPSTYDALIRRIAAQHHVDFALVKAVMHAESAFNPYAKSRKGAIGLMQLMPKTAERYGITDIYDPVQNIQAGVRHLKYLSQKFKNKNYLVIAAYNAGENAVKRYRGIPPYRETRRYVRKVLRYKRRYSVNS